MQLLYSWEAGSDKIVGFHVNDNHKMYNYKITTLKQLISIRSTKGPYEQYRMTQVY